MADVIVDKAIYRGGRREPCGDLSDELDRLRAAPTGHDFVWIGLKDPNLAEMQDVNAKLGLGLHPLAIEDAVHFGQRAKIERYPDSLFVVLKTLSYIEATSDVETGELMVYVGNDFVLTVRHGDISPLAGVRKELEADTAKISLGPLAALHAIMDRVVDQYLEVDEELQRDTEQIEEDVFSDRQTSSDAVYRLKREVMEFRRAVWPLLISMNLVHADQKGQGGELELQFRDVEDHLQTAADRADSYDRALSDVLNVNLAKISVQQNSDMRKISAWAAILAAPTAIAGIYGMNFENMPELRWRYGYFIVMAIMVSVCVGLHTVFKKKNWL